ncbi:MAG: hypothetical protein BWY91_01497 [bacterium ADurb.BinA028]|nr:MAG: hypothetical protein BWY91_01497 [bacterium ADurb.BinA028]
MPPGDLLVGQETLRCRVAIGINAVGEAQRLGPDAGVDDADDDALALEVAAGRRPEPAGGCVVQAEERRRRGRVTLTQFLGRDGHDAGSLGQGARLSPSELGGEAVEREQVVIELCRPTHLVQSAVVGPGEVGRVLRRGRCRGVELLARLGLRRRVSGEAPVIGGNRKVAHLDDVGPIGVCRPRRRRSRGPDSGSIRGSPCTERGGTGRPASQQRRSDQNGNGDQRADRRAIHQCS